MTLTAKHTCAYCSSYNSLQERTQALKNYCFKYSMASALYRFKLHHENGVYRPSKGWIWIQGFSHGPVQSWPEIWLTNTHTHLTVNIGWSTFRKLELHNIVLPFSMCNFMWQIPTHFQSSSHPFSVLVQLEF